MNSKYRLWAGLLCILASTKVGAADIPLESFARLPEFNDIVLSPDGRHIAASVPADSETNLAVLRLEDMKITASIRGGEDRHVARIRWANPERVLVEMADSRGPLDAPRLTGEIMGVDADGKNMQYLFGHNPPDTGLSKRRVTAGWGEILSILRSQPDQVLVRSQNLQDLYRRRDDARAAVYRLDVNDGRTSVVAHGPIGGRMSFVADEDGRVRYAAGQDPDTLETRTFELQTDTGSWREIDRSSAEVSLIPLRLSGDSRSVYLSARDGTDTYCLVERRMSSGDSRALSCHEYADHDGTFFSAEGNVPLAAVYEPGKLEIDWIHPEHPDAIDLRKLAQAFPGQAVIPSSRTWDGTKLVVEVFSDRNPGDYYLYDRKEDKAYYLASARSWIDPALMAERRPVQFPARDGTTLYGYLSLPPGRKPENLPLIVNPHGGPFGIRDNWAWQADAQMLASRGYAVLQVNFRGSGGYGNAYYEAARAAWGTLMIDDIVDGARWVIEQGIADRQRVCSYGGSYGGYSSLMMAVREPELVKCVIAYVGVYDLEALKRDSDIKQFRAGRNYMTEYIGDDPAELRAQSPLYQLDRLKAPVFIVHGKQDERAPYKQAKWLRDALEKRDHEFEWLVKSDEAHGFWKLENRVELYQRMLRFIEDHIGPGAPRAR